MALRTMDPARIRELLKGETDIITPAANVERDLLSYSVCPVCGSQGADKVVMAPKMIPKPDGSIEVLRAPFSSSSSLVVGHAKCRNCGTEYSPRTGVIIQSQASMIQDPFNDESQ